MIDATKMHDEFWWSYRFCTFSIWCSIIVLFTLPKKAAGWMAHGRRVCPDDAHAGSIPIMSSFLSPSHFSL